MEVLYCPKCKNASLLIMDRSTIKCSMCGTNYSLRAIAPIPKASTTEKRKSGFRTRQSPSDTYCPFCGLFFPSTVYCPECNAKIGSSDNVRSTFEQNAQVGTGKSAFAQGVQAKRDAELRKKKASEEFFVSNFHYDSYISNIKRSAEYQLRHGEHSYEYRLRDDGDLVIFYDRSNANKISLELNQRLRACGFSSVFTDISPWNEDGITAYLVDVMVTF